jgi:hypothetical protein
MALIGCGGGLILLAAKIPLVSLHQTVTLVWQRARTNIITLAS